MPIYVVKNKHGMSYRVFVLGSDGKLITETFRCRLEAKKFETEMLYKKQNGKHVSNSIDRWTVDDFYSSSFEDTHTKASKGWKIRKLQMYRDYVSPLIGKMKLTSVKGEHISQIIRKMSDMGCGKQLQLHVFNLLRKLFNDAVEDYEYLAYSPVKRKHRPELIDVDVPYLKVEEAKELLRYVKGKSYEVAIWLEVCLGLRAGEIQALTWDNVDLETGRIFIRKTYARNDKEIRNHPKEKKWRSSQLPPELKTLLILKRTTAESEYVALSPRKKDMMSYDGYLKAVKRYCRELGFNEIATHGLRHSFSGIFKTVGGGTDEQLSQHHNHSSMKVTKSYIHDDGGHVDAVMGKILLFPEQKTGT